MCPFHRVEKLARRMSMVYMVGLCKGRKVKSACANCREGHPNLQVPTGFCHISIVSWHLDCWFRYLSVNVISYISNQLKSEMPLVSEYNAGPHSIIARYLVWLDIGLFKSIEVVMNGLKAIFKSLSTLRHRSHYGVKSVNFTP